MTARVPRALGNALCDEPAVFPRWEGGAAAEVLNRRDATPELLADVATCTHAHEDDRKAALLRLTFDYLARSGVWIHIDGAHLKRIESNADRWPYWRLLSEIKLMLKSIARARGQRDNHATREKDRPYWQPQGSTTTGTRPTNLNQITNTEAQKMATYVEVPQEAALVDRGEHLATITSIGEPETSRFDEAKQSVKIVFEVAEGEFIGQRLSKFFTLNLSSKAGLGTLWRRLINAPQPGETVDLDQLIGQRCSISISHKDGEDGCYAVVQDVFAINEEAAIQA